MDLVPGRVIADRYRLETPLSSGGMGTIWVATHLLLDVKIAVKFMADATTGRARFEREAKAAARLTSPNVARTIDYGVDGDTPYIAMELLVGESLEARLARERTLSVAQASQALRQIARGLHEAHEHGIVHRDIKPANLFFARAGTEEVVKILDFGIAKDTRGVLVDEETKSGTMLGSPHHMSPEQARGGDIDRRSDLWSLGVVLFRALTGERPFSGTNVGDVIAKICADPIPRPSRFAPSLGPDVDAFFERALARNPSLRFSSAIAMADGFDEAVGIAPPPPSLRADAPPLLARTDEITRDAMPTQPTILAPRADATRDVEPIAEPERTAIGTTQAVSPEPERRSRRPLALFALLPLALAAAALFTWSRFGAAPEAPAPTTSSSSAATSAPSSSEAAPSEVAAEASSEASAPAPPSAPLPSSAPSSSEASSAEPLPSSPLPSSRFPAGRPSPSPAPLRKAPPAASAPAHHDNPFF